MKYIEEYGVGICIVCGKPSTFQTDKYFSVIRKRDKIASFCSEECYELFKKDRAEQPKNRQSQGALKNPKKTEK